MKKILMFLLIFIESKAVDLSAIGVSFVEEKSSEFILKKESLIDLRIFESIEYKEEVKDDNKRVQFKIESNCIDNHGESFYDAKAGIHYLYTPLLGLETGYQLVRVDTESLKELKIDSNHLGLYANLILKF